MRCRLRAALGSFLAAGPRRAGGPALVPSDPWRPSFPIRFAYRPHRLRRLRREAGADLLADALAGAGRGGRADGALIAGLDPPDDAAAYRVAATSRSSARSTSSRRSSTTRVDVRRIAAANALSDVFAMGGRVLFALSVAAFPEDLPRDAWPRSSRAHRPRFARPAGCWRAATRSATPNPSTAWR